MRSESSLLFTGCGHTVVTPIPFGSVFDSKPGCCPGCQQEGSVMHTEGLADCHPEAQLAATLAAQRTAVAAVPAGKVYDLGTGEYLLPAEVRARYEEEVKGLGKFEGQAPYVPYFYMMTLHGFGGESSCYCSECTCDDGTCAACCCEEYGCECDSSWEVFEVDEQDAAIFPELRVGQQVRIYFASTGAVWED